MHALIAEHHPAVAAAMTHVDTRWTAAGADPVRDAPAVAARGARGLSAPPAGAEFIPQFIAPHTVRGTINSLETMTTPIPNEEVLSALVAIASGATPDSLESDTLEFKQPIARSRDDTARKLADASICFSNAAGGTTVLGVRDKPGGPDAFIGTESTRAGCGTASTSSPGRACLSRPTRGNTTGRAL